jgi:hypothetical protein
MLAFLRKMFIGHSAGSSAMHRRHATLLNGICNAQPSSDKLAGQIVQEEMRITVVAVSILSCAGKKPVKRGSEPYMTERKEPVH